MNDQAEKLRNLMKNSNKKLTPCKKAKIISISSGKGGVGKTSFALNFAISLSRLGFKIAIIDADIGLSNIEILSGVNIRYSLSDIIFLNKSIFEVAAIGPEGINIISGGSGFNEFKIFKDENFPKLIEEMDKLQETVDYIIIDTGAGISETVIDFLMTTEEVIVVCTPDPTSLMDSYILIKTLLNGGFVGKINLLANLVKNKKEGQDVFEKLKHTVKDFLKYDIEYLGFLEWSNVPTNAIKQQVPFVILHPNSSVSRKVNLIAMKFIEEDKIIDREIISISFADKLFQLFKKRGS